MKSFDFNRKYDNLVKYKDNAMFLELCLTSIYCPLNKIFWTRFKDSQKLFDEDGNFINMKSEEHFITSQNIKHTEKHFIKMPFPFKKQKE